MLTREGRALVYVDLDGTPHFMGRPWIRVRKNKESATFEYDVGWLKHPANRPRSSIPARSTRRPTPMFRALGDSAPDRWGRALMRRMERRRERNETEESLRARPLLSMRICSSQDRADTDGMNFSPSSY
jgi:serine/threonine-protein kinase HipA